MGLFDRLNTRAVTWNKFYGDGVGPKTASGTSVSETTALKHSVVWSSVTLIADAISSLQPEAFREDIGTGKRENVPVPRWIIKPSPTYRRNDIISQLLISALLWGNGYALLARRDSDGLVVGMVVLDPSTVECEWDPNKSGYRRYRLNGTGQWLSEGDVLHLQGATFPGKAKGMSVIAQARESIGLGLTLEEFAARYFGQGSHQKVVINVPTKVLSEPEARDLVRQYEQFNRGPGNWHRPAVVSGKEVSLTNVSIPPEDAQFLQSRQNQDIDVARWFRVPPHRVGIIGVQTSWGSGLAEENTALVQNTYRPWIDRLEAVYTFYSPGGEDSGVRIRLNVSELLRGSFKDMVSAWGEAVTTKIATPNEARSAIGLDPIDGGDKLQEDAKPAPVGDKQSEGAEPRYFLVDNGEIVRHLPGQHNQKDHGKPLHASPEYSDLDSKGKAAVDGALAAHGISIDELEGHFTEVCAKADMTAARNWYPEAHKYATELATKHKVSVEQAAAVIAITSPRNPWPQNKKAADRILGHYREHEGLSSSEAADRIGGGLRKNMIPAIDVARDESLVNDKITGTKRRSFYNNIVAPGGTRDVTVDTWMLESVRATSDRPMDKDAAFDLLSVQKSATKVGAGYVGVSEGVRRTADKLGETPDTIQSAYWIQMSGSAVGKTGR